MDIIAASLGPAPQGDGAPDITSEMVEAGIGSIRSLEYDFWESTSPEEKAVLVKSIYQVMADLQNRGALVRAESIPI